MSNERVLKPMSFWSSLLYFGIPSMVITGCIYYLWPYLNKIGTPAIVSFTFIMYVPLASLLVAALIAFLLEGNKMSWVNIKNRFRLKSMKKKRMALDNRTYYFCNYFIWRIVIFRKMVSFYPAIFASRLFTTCC